MTTLTKFNMELKKKLDALERHECPRHEY